MALHRPYIRKSVREEVKSRAQKNENGQFLDANTGQPIEGKYDIGHKTGHEYRTALAEAEEQGLSQSEFNDLQNNPDILQIEDPSSNRSHAFEQKETVKETVNEETTENIEMSNYNSIEESTEDESVSEGASLGESGESEGMGEGMGVE